MKKTINIEDYFYTDAKDFIQDEGNMQHLAVGCIEEYLRSKEFDDCVLQSIIGFSGELEFGYPDESKASIEIAFKGYKERVLVLMKNHILSAFGYSYLAFPYEDIVDFIQDNYKIGLLAVSCGEGHEGDLTEFIKSEAFAIEALRSIKAYNFKIGVGYPFENEEEIEAAVEKYKVVDAMRKCLENATSIDDLIA